MESELVKRKIEQIEMMIQDLKDNAGTPVGIGGRAVRNTKEEIELQEKRLVELEKYKEISDRRIRAKRKELMDTLEKDEKDCIYGMVRGLSPQTIETIAKIEDIDIALGEHPALKEIG